MNNRSFDGIAIIFCFALTLLASWCETSSFTLGDRVAFVGLTGIATLWFISQVYSKSASANQSKLQADVDPLAEFVTIFPEEVDPELEAEVERFEAQLDAQIAEIEAKNPIAAAMTETELLHYLVDCLDRPIEDTQPEEVTPVLEVLPVEVTPKKTRSKTAAKSRKTVATATVKEPEDKPKAKSTVSKAKTRSTTKKTTASSKARSTKKSGEA